MRWWLIRRSACESPALGPGKAVEPGGCGSNEKWNEQSQEEAGP